MASLDVGNGVRRGQALCARACGGVRDGVCLLRELRDDISPLEMHSAGRRGGSGVVVTRGQIHAMESRGKVAGQGLGACIRGRLRRRTFMQRADNYWLFSDDTEKLVCMVNDMIEGLLDSDMDLESLRWTSIYKDEDARH